MANKTGKKFGGRQKGTPNRVTTDMRVWLAKFFESQQEQLEKDWPKLSPWQRFVAFERLLRFCLPQLQNTELKTDLDKMTDDQLDHVINKILNEPRS